MTMPIITTQRRMAEKGRIRIGQKVLGTRRDGSTYTRPDKLDRFRFTSADRALIEQIARTYGGQAVEWDNAGRSEFEVVTDARSIPVIVVKGGFSQWHEFWSKGGLQHRCDGEKDPAGVYCDPDSDDHLAALEKPTTRLSVMLAEIETLGVWRLETKGWNAAAELPSMAELAMHVGDLVPATLSLAERSSIVETPGGTQTSRFVVPMLDLQVTKRRLMEIAATSSGVAPALAGPVPAVAAIESAPATARPYGADIAEAATLEELRVVWGQVQQAGHMTADVEAVLRGRAQELQEQLDAVAEESGEDDPWPVREDVGAVGAGVADGAGDVDAAWFALVAKAGAAGWSEPQLREALEAEYAQPVEDLDAGQLTAFAAKVGAA
jgi:hypothetical protein